MQGEHMGGFLTTHVLDTARGCPAAHMSIELWRVSPGGSERRLLTTVCTNADGRTPEALLAADEFAAGVYELEFAVGEYFAAQGVATPEIPFLDRVTIRFGIADAGAHYHVPLLVSPWAYSTYRGS
jgi:5-hydroxyisourate hydrolase